MLPERGEGREGKIRRRRGREEEGKKRGGREEVRKGRCVYLRVLARPLADGFALFG